MNKIMIVFFLSGMVIGFCSIGSAWAQEGIPVVEKHPPIEMTTVEERPLVQMAILLDTSGSMSGLIDQARTELWAIVNEFIFAKRNGKEPELQRAVTKSSLYYKNEFWDLVDAVSSNKVKLEEVKEEDLPEKMQKMSKEERKTYIEAQAKQRVKIQRRIQELNKQRKKYVAEEMKKRQLQGYTLGSAVIKAVRDQAKEKNFTFESSEKSSKNLDPDASQ